MGKSQREKGRRGEILWRNVLRSLGWTGADRSARNGVRHGEDVMGGIPGTLCEVKFVEKLNVRQAMRQAVTAAGPGKVPYVAHKTSRDEWLVTLRASDLRQFAELVAGEMETTK